MHNNIVDLTTPSLTSSTGETGTVGKMSEKLWILNDPELFRRGHENLRIQMLPSHSFNGLFSRKKKQSYTKLTTGSSGGERTKGITEKTRSRRWESVFKTTSLSHTRVWDLYLLTPRTRPLYRWRLTFLSLTLTPKDFVLWQNLKSKVVHTISKRMKEHGRIFEFKRPENNDWQFLVKQKESPRSRVPNLFQWVINTDHLKIPNYTVWFKYSVWILVF